MPKGVVFSSPCLFFFSIKQGLAVDFANLSGTVTANTLHHKPA